MKKTNKFFYFLLVSFLFINCSKNNQAAPPVNPPPVVAPTPLITLPAEWTKATNLMTGFPSGIEVYKRTAAFNGKAMNAYCVVFDPKNSSIELKPVYSSTNKKPSELYANESGTNYAVINGGFFGTNASYSLTQYNGSIQAINIKSLTRTYNGANTTYYPTRGAFGLTSAGIPDVTWIYHVGAGNGTIYSYPQPSANNVTMAPQPQPSATFPAGGAVWNAITAIGGSPVLIKNNTVNVTDDEELIDIDNTSSRARSAIGHTSDGKIILLAVEGNNSSGGAGLNLKETADLMKGMGCTGALNLDGGGSTYMMVNGLPTVKPSDAGGERPVISAIIIKKK
ncbi:MAG: phosphodiester glycosidase family protein [Flavisolibacter sp.]|nr:phosphodiester glycosidase family protein [Flavisolibacter sp.]